MGEMEVDNFEAMEIEVVDKVEKKQGSSSMVRWENFVPRTSLRVLLVEADDSTRQIIGALLRKCSYKVATAPDGLKAWEVLKARPRNIDLILTEMELPSISGYALLTLIMEHDICKNIPVIMMSKYDTVSTVYKCMTRGAADFLVKPIRINELKNLWQHVWRRQSQVNRVGLGPQNDGVAQEQLEATAENNAISDPSSGSKACVPMREDCLKKGSDAQSSCGKVDLEGDAAYLTDVEVYSQPKQGVSPVSELRVQEHLVCGHSAQNLSTPESAAADTAAYKGNSVLDRQERLERQSYTDNVNLCTLSGSNKVITNSPREAIDLIGAFDSNSKRHLCTNDGAIRSSSTPHLDLSLMRCSIAVENKMGNENPMLNRSNTSAFTRYVNNTVLQASNTTATSDSTPKNNKVQSGDHLFPIPLSMGEARVDGSSTPRTICTVSPSPSSTNKPMNSYHQFNVVDQIPRISSSEPVCRSLEDRARLSANDQCGSSYLCEDGQTARHLSGLESGSEQTRITPDMRALQREAALNKFRLKRKERCFDKKVRYESRKKLAEQRPRVKGQFVRQVPPDSPPPKSNHSVAI